jgi:nucleoside-diphosphate-sugar epimerase
VKVFVAGASGAIGRPLIGRLVAVGHEVTGMTRRPEQAALIRDAGAAVAVCDVYDRDALTAAVSAANPDVVIHQLTSLPPNLDLRDERAYEANNRIRREGTANLVEAALAAGAKRMVAQSIGFIYAPVGSWVKSEADPVFTSAPGGFGTAVAATMDLERQVVGAEGLEGLALRYGFFYGPGTAYARDGHQAAEVRKRRFPIVGGGDGVFSFIHVDDAASATVAATERGDPGIYNVTDDEPAPLRDWLPVYADAVGAKRPMRVPKLIARVVAGGAVVGFATALRGAANDKAKLQLGWQPRYASWRQGFSEALG